MKQTICLFIVIIALDSLAQGTSSESYEDSQITQLVQSHVQEGVVWLGPGSKAFLSLFLESQEPEGVRAAIILHSMGMHADWPELIAPVRRQLPELGWATLSVQLPLLDPQSGHAEYGSTFNQANDRIRVAIRYLQDRAYTEIVIIGYGFGATSAVNYLTGHISMIKALVGISMQPHPFLKPKYDLLQELSNINIPILDIYGSKDFSGVLKSADDRRLAANKAGNGLYNQLVIQGANHYFTMKEKQLAEQLVVWMNSTVVDGEKN
jgi:pimeloyl-ACP methyl ester carboxylesterase